MAGVETNEDQAVTPCPFIVLFYSLVCQLFKKSAKGKKHSRTQNIEQRMDNGNKEVI